MIKHFVPKVSKNFEVGLTLIGKNMHLSRKKFLFALIFSVIMQRSVNFNELALCLNNDADTDSNLRRIQRFFAKHELN
jgi:hypothetical protein